MADPVIDERARILAGDHRLGRLEMAQPAESVQCPCPVGGGRVDLERRAAARFRELPGEQEPS